MRKTIILIFAMFLLTAFLATNTSAIPVSDPCIAIHSLQFKPAIKKELQNICFGKQKVLGVDAWFIRPTADIAAGIEKLAATHTDAPGLYAILSSYQVFLGEQDAAEKSMLRFVELEGETEQPLLELASFYNERMMYDREIKTLEKLAKIVDRDDAREIYHRILDSIDANLLTQFNKYEYYRAIVALFPDNPYDHLDLISILLTNGKLDEAESELKIFLEKHPGNVREYLSHSTWLLRERNREDESIKLYAEMVDPFMDPDTVIDYIVILREKHELGNLRKELVTAREKGKLTWKQFGLLAEYYRYKGDYESVNKLIDEQLEGYSFSKATREQNRGFAELLSRCWRNDLAVKFYYSLYNTEEDGEEKADLAYKIFDQLSNAEKNKNKTTPASIGEFFNLRHADANPSFTGGILSLLLNDKGLDYRKTEFDYASMSYFNNKAAHDAFLEFAAQSPASPHLPDMYLSEIKQLVDYTKYADALALADRFKKELPDSDRMYDIQLQAARIHNILKNNTAEASAYFDLVEFARSHPDHERLDEMFDKYISCLIRQQKSVEVLDAYWAEIERRPDDEAIYLSFLELINANNLYDEELKVYKKAISNFDDTTWRHKLARWYIRHKEKTELKKLSKEVVDVFSSSELEYYLRDFVSCYTKNCFESSFYLDIYLYSLEKYPFDTFIISGLLDYYSYNKKYPEFENLALKYYNLNWYVRERLMGRFSSSDKIDKILASARAELDSNTIDNPQVHYRLIADMLAWQSKYEEALTVYDKSLLPFYPGDLELLETTANLYRSIDHSFYVDSKDYTERAADLYSRMTDIYPQNYSYRTLAGEVWAESGDYDRASKYWDSLIDIQKGDESVYLEVATIYWDYYQFEKSVSTILNGRKALDSPNLHCDKMAAVYESMKYYKEAIDEYIKAIDSEYIEQWRVVTRLAYIAKHKNLSADIEAAFKKWIDSEDTGWQVAIAYTEYLDRMKRPEDRDKVFRSIVDKYDYVAFLDIVENYFKMKGNFEFRMKTIERMFEVSGYQPYYFRRMASLYDTKGMVDEAAAVYQMAIEKFEDIEPNEGDLFNTLLEASSYLELNSRTDKALDYFARAIELAPDWRKSQMQTELAAKYADANQFDRASKLLVELTENDPASVSIYDAYAGMLVKQKRGDDLLKAIDKALDRLKDVPLSASAMKDKVRYFRLAQVSHLAELGMFTEAQDQYIEVINKFPLDTYITEQAYDFSKEHGLADRMFKFYEKTAQKSHKNYRWHVLLAQFSESDGKIPEAIAYMRTATEVEPSKTELWQKIVELSKIVPDYKTGIESSMKLFSLTEDFHYKMDAARFHFQAGEKDKAEAIVMEIFSGNSPDCQKYFEAAAIFKGWGMNARTSEMFEKGFAAFRKDPYKRSLSSDWLQQAVDFYIENDQLSELHNILDEVNNTLYAETTRKTNFNRNMIENSIYTVSTAEWNLIPSAVNKYARRSDHIAEAALVLAVVKDSGDILFDKAIDTASGYLDDPTLLKTLYKTKINYYKSSSQQYHWDYYQNSVLDLVNYYESHLDYRAAADTLEQALTVYYSPDFMLELGRIYDMFDEQEKRLVVLEKHYNYVTTQTTYGNNVESGFNQTHPDVYDYFALLRELGHKTKLDALTGEKNYYTGQYLNYLIDSGDMERAIATIDRAMSYKNAVWKNSKKALIYKHFDNPAGMPLMESILAIDDVQGSMDHKADRNSEFIGDMWYDFGMLYAGFIEMSGGDSSDYALSLVESHPLDAYSYQRTGNFFLESGDAERAIEFFETAADINGSWTLELYDRMATAYLSLDQKEKAFEQWKLTVANEKSISNYLYLFGRLTYNGFDKEAGDYLKEGILYAAANSGMNYDFNQAVHILHKHLELPEAEWKKFIDSVFEAAGSDFDTAYRISMSRFLSGEGLASYMKKTATLTSSLSNDDLRGYMDDSCYDSCINGCYESCDSIDCYSCEYSCDTCYNYYSDSSYVFWKMLLDYQIDNGLDAGAVETVNDIRRLKLNTIEPFDINMAEIDAMIGTGDFEATMARITEILKDKDPNEDNYIYIEYYSQLFTAGQEELADDVMLLLYDRLSPEYMANADYTGLARIQLKRDMEKEALETIDRMLRAAPENTEALWMAASLFEEFDMFKKAVDLRKRIASIAPTDHNNNLARLVSSFKAGDKKDVLKELEATVLSDNIPMDIRMDAVHAIADNYDSLKPDKLVGVLEKIVKADEKPQTIVPFMALYELKKAAGDDKTDDILKAAVNSMYIPYKPAITLAESLANKGDDGALDMFQKAFGLGVVGYDDMMQYAILLHDKGLHNYVFSVIVSPEYIDIASLTGSGGTCLEYETGMIESGVSKTRIAAFIEAVADSSEKAGVYDSASTLYECAASLGGRLPWSSIELKDKAARMKREAEKKLEADNKLWEFNINFEPGI